MNQDEEVPARVTRGALRRRSVDQEATPQKPSGAATNGTPKKSASTTKKVAGLNAIQETEGRPSTPIVGRSTRRRMSETMDTPTSLPNKVVKNLKESESNIETGRRSRNASLTEENLNELNAAFEGGSGMMPTRSRTPARLRASHDTLASVSSPQMPVRRSTRRNSITSDDGSVQSLPITTPKVSSGARTVKDDTIIEEDPNEDRAESVSSEASSRITRRQSTAAVKSSSASPRSAAASPVMRNESTPPRAVKSPGVAVSPLAQTKGSPLSKNTKQFHIVVEDLRNSELMGVTPKVDAEVNLNAKPETNDTPNKSIAKSPAKESADGDASQTKEVGEDSDNVQASPEPAQETVKLSNSAIKQEMNTSTTDPTDNVSEVNPNDVSGIEMLDASVQEVTASLPEASTSVQENVANKSTSEGDKLSLSWSQSVRRSATKGIDEFSVRKQEEQQRLEEEAEKLQQAQAKSPLTSHLPRAERSDEENDDEMGEEEEEVAQDKNEFVDDEALEMEGYESGDSLASDLRKEMEDNEIVDQGEDLGSEDTEDNDEQEEDDEEGNDSFIVSTGDEDELLRDTEDEDLKTNGASLLNEETKKPPKRRRIIQMADDSDEDDKEINEDIKPPTTPKSPKNTSFKRLGTPSSVGDKTPSKESNFGTPAKKSNLADEGNNTPSKQSDISKTTEAIESKDESNSAVNTPATNNASMESSGDVVELENSVTNPATPVRNTPSKDTGSALNSAAKTLSNSKREGVDNAAASEDENNTSGNSDAMFQDAEDIEESSPKSGNDTVKEVSFKKSPEKSATKSRNSLPATSVHTKERVGNGRKSLPANAYGKTVEQDEKVDEVVEDEPQTSEPDVEVQETVDLVNNDEEAVDELDRSMEQADTATLESSHEQPKNDAEPKQDRKSMPAIPMISAQFYIGGSKKRATISGSDSLNANKKTKKQKDKEEKTANATNVGSSVVPNPFALGAKPKARLSLDSGAEAAQPAKEKLKKGRHSLPSKFIEEPMEVDETPLGETKSTETSKNDKDGDASGEIVVVQDQEMDVENKQPKMPKPKRKALEDYDLANILLRCNDVIRVDKERKKEAASALRKKREEKKRLRELEKQQELEAAKESAAANTLTDNDDGGLNSSTTGNDSVTQGGEPLKKKKKRKPKVKNYVLEELAETKKERLLQALRHKQEVLERRKQRKKERQLEQKKQLDKENGVGTAAGAGTGGIGAKLEKMKKKQKAKSNGEKLKEPPVRVALSAFAVFNALLDNQIEPLECKKQETEVVQSKNMQLTAPAVEKKQHKQSPKKEETPEQLMEQPAKEDTKKANGGPPVEEEKKQSVVSKQLKKSPKKEETPDQTVIVKEGVKKAKVGSSAEEKENQTVVHKETKTKKKQVDKNGKAVEHGVQSGTSPTVDKTQSNDDEVPASKKKATLATKTQSESALDSDSQPTNTPLPKSVSEGMLEEAGKLTKKQKRKLARMESSTAAPEAVVPSEAVKLADQANGVIEKRKDKKKRKEPVVEEELTPNDLVFDTVPKQKKNKKQTQNGKAEENGSQLVVSSKLANGTGTHEIRTEAEEVPEKKKKKLKKLLAVQDEEQARSTLEKSRKNVTSVERVPIPAAVSVVPTKKRKREQTDSPATLESTPRPAAKHTKLRVLQRIESGGFFEENVTPDKVRLKRNFGFEERQATPAKQLGFRVSSLLPTDQDELRAAASSSKMHSKGGQKKTSKHGGGGAAATTLPEPNRSLPLPVWTSSGMFLESPAEDDNDSRDVKKVQKQRSVSNPKTTNSAGYIQLKSQGNADFRLKTLRPAAEKPHRVDPSTTEQSVINYKRQELLQKTAHLREKKSHRV